MEYPREASTSPYGRSDTGIRYAGYATLVYATEKITSAVFRYFGSEITSQTRQVHTTGEFLVAWVIIAAVFGALAFSIFRGSRVGVVITVALVLGTQLVMWWLMLRLYPDHWPRLLAATVFALIVIGFLLRGARRIFQHHAEHPTSAQKV